MYETYWHLKQKPFENAADPRYYYPDESHQAALMKLRYAIENRRGAALLTGPSGSGKTMVANMLRNMLGPEYSPFVNIVFPQMPTADLLAYLADELDGTTSTETPSVQSSVRRIERMLAANVEEGRHAVVTIDEAHLLDSPQTFEALRLLLNFEPRGTPGLTLLLSGQPSLLPMLHRMPQGEERLGVKCLLRPLTQAETAQYVAHRFRAAGGDPGVFDEEALAGIHRLTLGLPRRINRLADLALLIGYAEQRKTLSAAQLGSIHEELVAVVPE